MPLTTPQEIIDKYTKLTEQMQSLIDRWDQDYALYKLDPGAYAIPASEGEWNQTISDRASTEGNKIIDLLTYASRKLWIPISDEKEKGRKDLTLTEQFANGTFYLYDQMQDEIPDGQSIQSSLSFFRTIRGSVVILNYLSQEDEEGKIIPIKEAWDIRNTRYIYGNKHMIYVCNEHNLDENTVKDEYPGWNGKVDPVTGLVVVYTVWKAPESTDGYAQEGVIIDKEWVRELTESEVHYIPVRIKFGRSTPLISDKARDNIKMLGESYMASNRLNYIRESRLLTYKMTAAAQEAKQSRIIKWNSGLADAPPDLTNKDPFMAGRVLNIDVAKGEDMGDVLLPKASGHIDSALMMTKGDASRAGLSDIAYGHANVTMTAQGTDILSHATMDIVKPFKQGVEDDLAWIAKSDVSQYKNGNFEEYELEGYDRHQKFYRQKIDPAKINDRLIFKCELIPDLMRDKAANIGMALQATSGDAPLMSKQTARDQYNLVDDPDLEAEIISREKSNQIAKVDLWKMALSLVKDGNTTEAQMAINEIIKLSEPPPQAPQGPDMGAVPGQMMQPNNGMMARRLPVPPDVQAAAGGMTNV